MHGKAMNTDLLALKFIEKLKGSKNYGHWSALMRQYLKTENLWDTVQAPTGAASATAAVNRDPDKMNAALLRIFLSLGKIPLGIVERETSPRAAWEKLEAFYLCGGAKGAQNDDATSRRDELLRELKGIKLNNFNTCEEYIIAVERAHEALVRKGGEIQEGKSANASLCDSLFAGLSKDDLCYQSLKDKTTASGNLMMQPEELKRRIRRVWYRENGGSSEDHNSTDESDDDDDDDSDDDNSAAVAAVSSRKRKRPYYQLATLAARKPYVSPHKHRPTGKPYRTRYDAQRGR